MNVEARRLGVELRPTGSLSSYRDLAGQQELWRRYQNGTGALAAVPGRSNHGLGRAVDVPFQNMRQMIDRIGRKYGWAAGPGTWSDAPSEWWHCVHRAGIWSGPDPGPTGQAAPPKPKPQEPEIEEDIVRYAIGYEADGRLHLARIEGRAGNNQIFRRWLQRDGKWSPQWVRTPAAEGRNRPWVSVQFARHPNGRLELFAMTDQDQLWRIHQQAPNGAWAGQFVRA